MPGESKSSPREIQNYLGRISGPLLDRIDLHIEVPPVKFREIAGDRTGETSAQIRGRVVAARQRQHERFADKPKITCNARMRAFDIYTTHYSCRKHQKNKSFLPSQAVSARNQDRRRFAHGQAKTGRIYAQTACRKDRHPAALDNRVRHLDQPDTVFARFQQVGRGKELDAVGRRIRLSVKLSMQVVAS